MKKIFKSVLFIFFLAVIISGCKKDASSNPSTSDASGGTSYKVDGSSTITVDSTNAVLYTNVATKIRTIDVYAFKGGKQVLECHFLPKTGDQVVYNAQGATASLSFLENQTASFDAQSGSFNLTVCDTIGKKIVGTFGFVGKPYPYTANTTHTITEGKLSVTKFKK
jgi:hypothetical protein